MTQNVLVLSAAPYVIKNEKTGEVENNGCTVRYVVTETLTTCEDEKKSIKGYKPAKANMPIDDYQKFNTVPAIYSVEFAVNVDSQGKTTLKEIDFKFLSGIAVTKIK